MDLKFNNIEAIQHSCILGCGASHVNPSPAGRALEFAAETSLVAQAGRLPSGITKRADRAANGLAVRSAEGYRRWSCGVALAKLARVSGLHGQPSECGIARLGKYP